jgi:hypothetical protein
MMRNWLVTADRALSVARTAKENVPTVAEVPLMLPLAGSIAGDPAGRLRTRYTAELLRMR